MLRIRSRVEKMARRRLHERVFQGLSATAGGVVRLALLGWDFVCVVGYEVNRVDDFGEAGELARGFGARYH